ncbi:hypothetical protein EON65_12730 [archaeon]|nr:MAG: hypothetical protein EON65_12730 [archaeon]
MNKKATKARSGIMKSEVRVSSSIDKTSTDQTEEPFDCTRVVDNSLDICGFCKEGYEFGLMLKRQYFSGIAGFDMDESSDEDEHDIKDVDGVWVSKYSLMGPRRLFAHYICALRSPKVRKNGKKWYNVRKEITRGSSFECYKCFKRGASIGCFEPRCGVVMHYHCAVTVGYCYYRFKDKFFLCEEHRKLVLERDVAKDADMPVDISAGRETIRVGIPINQHVHTLFFGSHILKLHFFCDICGRLRELSGRCSPPG